MPCTEHCSSNLGEDMRSSQDGSHLKAMKAVSFSRNGMKSKLNGHIAKAVDEVKVTVFSKRDFLKNIAIQLKMAHSSIQKSIGKDGL